MFGLILQHGSLPDCWKLANVTPIFKKGPSSNPDNYRPISLTCIICKVFESVIKDQLLAFLESREDFVPRTTWVSCPTLHNFKFIGMYK